MPQSMLVLGLGKSGIATARHMLANGDDFTVYAGVSSDTARAAAAPFEQAGVPLIFDSEDVEGEYSLGVISPGIPQTGNFYKNAAAACTELVSEPEYAWRISPDNWIAVTGTNGKTTTTSLITHLLNESGCSAVACGNIGDTALEAVENRSEGQTLVVEMSSFQLASTAQFAPRVAVLLNITPDHIAWHGSFEEYARAKFRVFESMQPGSSAIVTRGIVAAYPDEVAALEDRKINVIRVGVEEERNCAFVGSDGKLCVKDAQGAPQALVMPDELNIKGSHNLENALCSAAAALAAGCDVGGVIKGLKSFMPLEHRIEPCGVVNDVEFFNDSKATNVDATLKALTAFADRKIILLLGGHDKGTDLRELVGACTDVTRAVIAYGAAGQRFYEAFAMSSIPVYLEPGMRAAFDHACEIACPGDAIVLSPACASFDEFDSFVQRGRVFKEYVNELSERA